MVSSFVSYMWDIVFAFNWNINQLLKKPRRRQWDERGNEKGRGMIGMKQRGRGNSEYNRWTVHISSPLLRFSSNAFRHAASSFALSTNTSGIYFSVCYSLRIPWGIPSGSTRWARWIAVWFSADDSLFCIRKVSISTVFIRIYSEKKIKVYVIFKLNVKAELFLNIQTDFNVSFNVLNWNYHMISDKKYV